ncbi:MAG: diguanylate cyclase [Marinisporobacter sp.]|jgi:diguanylate cyclase (GGDEF)-like protein|nr:diguanylate cyclase [Marinisporobacter sp.]
MWSFIKKQDMSLQKGYLDLTSVDLTNEGTILLKGEWEFYDNIFLKHNNDGQIENKFQYIRVPSKWNNLKNSLGYGTYRGVIRINDIHKIYGIKIPIVSSACKVYVNGNLIGGNGIPTKNKKSTKGSWSTKVRYFKTNNPEIEILVHVSNFSHIKGGMVWGNIEFGIQKNINDSRGQKIGVIFFVFGFILAIGIYHFIIFIYKRKNRASLYFGLFCLIMALRILITGDTLFTALFYEIPLEIHAKLEYLTITLGCLFFLLYLSKYSEGVFYKGIIFKLTYGFIIIYSILIIFTDLWWYSRLLWIMYILIFAYFIVEMKENFRRYCKNIIGESVSFYSTLLFMISVLNDIFYTRNFLDRYYIYLGTLILVLGNTVKMSIQVSKNYERIEHWSKALDQEVKQRTKELEEVNQKLYYVATRDALTSLYNRQFLDQTIREENVKVASDQINVYSVLYIDLDNFKYFNDVYGHGVGDLIIKEFANLLSIEVGNMGKTYRMGGDEFTVLLPNLSLDIARKLAVRIIEKIKDNAFVIKSIKEYYDEKMYINKNQKITCSIGITASDKNINIHELINKADHAMLEAKEKGKNRYVIK